MYLPTKSEIDSAGVMEALVGGEIWGPNPTSLKSGLAAERNGSGTEKVNERSGAVSGGQKIKWSVLCKNQQLFHIIIHSRPFVFMVTVATVYGAVWFSIGLRLV